MNASEIDKFLQDGWVILDIPQAEVLRSYAKKLEAKLQSITGTACTLADVHHHVDGQAFQAAHQALSEYFWQDEFSLAVGKVFLPLLKDLVGLDIMVQYMPYLRLARPHRSEDNIGYHKDTQYGQTPYELAVHIPFVDLDDDSALKVISGSHRQAESDYHLMEGMNTQVVKGSIEHRLGKPYAPRRLGVPEGKKLTSLSMRVGQAAFFTPALFHGQELNSGKVTRVSTDMRFVSSNAKVELKTGKTHAGYVPLSHSPVSRLAHEYFEAQRAVA